MKNPEVATVSLIAVIMMIALYYNLNYGRQKSRLIINVIGLLIIVAVYHFEKSIKIAYPLIPLTYFMVGHLLRINTINK